MQNRKKDAKNINMYDYQSTNRYFAQAADDIKDIAERELIELGAKETSPAYRGIYFTAEKEELYSINYYSLLINRVLAPITTFKCHSDRYLYKQSMQINWEVFLKPSRTFAVFASVSNSSIKHSQFAALRLKDAVVDYFRDLDGKRPSIDTHKPDLWLNLHIENNKATISIDTSGGSLHRRGYRVKSVEAPMIETLAAAIIRYSEWDCKRPLYDPFCGSGTLLCEAFLKSSGMPPGKLRKYFGFEQLPDFNKNMWSRIKKQGEKINVDLPRGIISGSDISKQAVNVSRNNCSVIDKTGIIRILKKDIFDIESIHDSHIVCNPPYGIRLKGMKSLKGFYKDFGDFLKQKCKGSAAFIYFGERQHIKEIGLKPAWKKPLHNGGLDGRLVKYELY
ncbi:class I SAM-dependent RNA methyltransferase [Thermodesulfobacteriota bacterium]